MRRGAVRLGPLLISRRLLGRGENADLQVDSITCELLVSRRHCELTRDVSGTWHIEELGSQNGTALSGRRLRAGKRAALADGDTIKLGGRITASDAWYRFEIETTAACEVSDYNLY